MFLAFLVPRGAPRGPFEASDFPSIFWSILGGFLRPLGTQVGSQSGPKLEKNPGKIGVRCRLALGVDFCSILVAKRASKNMKNQAPAAAGAIFFIFLNFASWVPFGSQLGPILVHLCYSKRGKIAPEWASKLDRKSDGC